MNGQLFYLFTQPFTDFFQQACTRSRRELRRHPRLLDSTLGLPSRNGSDSEHAGDLWWQPYTAILQRSTCA
jgi:hypothetical protein